MDLSPVRLHSDAHAAGLAASELARAVTVGADVYFGAGEHRPATPQGEKLIAHELAHVVQGLGGNERTAGSSDPEAAARDAAEMVSRSGAAAVGLRGVPQPFVARSPKTWKELVQDANAEPDLIKKSAAMVALVRRALSGTTVREAGTSSPGAVDPADYDAAPAVNFDVRLNSKNKWRSTMKADINVGYTFTTTIGGASKAFSILGPKALNPDVGELHTQMYASHELFHAGHQATSTGSDTDQEVEAWTDTFIKHFLPMYVHRESWGVLINYYEGASSTYQTSSLNSLVAYATGLSTAPSTTLPSHHSDRQAFEIWLKRRLHEPGTATKKLVVALSTRLGITLSSGAPPP